MNNEICIVRDKRILNYPDSEEMFRPSERYPELVGEKIANKSNDVYGLVRKAFHLLKLDEGNYDTENWNPLGKYISPGNCVLIKPNLVLDQNLNPNGGVECLYTHPSVTAAVIDYVLIALRGSGKIIIGDAPVQECRFEELVESSGYRKLVEYYSDQGIDIQLKDCRNTRTYVDNGIRYDQDAEKKRDLGTIVKIDDSSAFHGFSDDHFRRLRVTNFDPRIMYKHHNECTHEYIIAKDVLSADVIINLPKPKTHRKAGVTGALKNLVGINASKECLPHHTLGSPEEEGDAYKHKNNMLSHANYLLDEKNILVSEGKYAEARRDMNEYEVTLKKGKEEVGERYWEGSWYGNDTIWRSVSDLNKIILYADKKGVMQKKVQRKHFIIGDMIISGEKEGPLWPSPKPAGIIMVGENPISFDRAVCSIMGFDYRLIHPLQGEKICEGDYALTIPEHDVIISNRVEWDKKDLDEIRGKYSLGFQPTKGWECLLGNPLKDELIKELLAEGMPVVIFGAGGIGIDVSQFILEKTNRIQIVCFYDNDEKKWGKRITGDLYCRKPEQVDGNYVCLVAANKINIKEISEHISDYQFKKIFYWSE